MNNYQQQPQQSTHYPPDPPPPPPSNPSQPHHSHPSHPSHSYPSQPPYADSHTPSYSGQGGYAQSSGPSSSHGSYSQSYHGHTHNSGPPPLSYGGVSGSYGIANPNSMPPPPGPSAAPAFSQHSHPVASAPYMPPPPSSSVHYQISSSSTPLGIESVQIQRTSSYEQNLNSRGNSSPVPSSGASLKRTTSRIDPAQMPRPDRPVADVIFHTKSGSARKNPPTVNSIFTAVDTGNCNPRFMRSTLVAPPCNKDLLLQTGLPLALHATPFACVENGEESVPQVNLNQAPPRCSRCKSYINPSVGWTDAGNKWNCNMCNMANAVPDWYYSSLDSAGIRLDKAHRPELCRGSVDFLVGDDYCMEVPKDPVVVFAVDISEEAQKSGITIASLRSIHKAIFQLEQLQMALEEQVQMKEEKAPAAAAYPFLRSPVPPAPLSNSSHQGKFSPSKSAISGIRVGILTFHENIQFYSVEGECADPIRMFVCDAEDPFAVLPPNKWLYSVKDEVEKINQILQKIPELLSSQQLESNSVATRKLCPHAVVKAMHDALKLTGGKLYLFTSLHSTVGVDSSTFDRHDLVDYGGADELLLYAVPENISQYSKNVKSATNTLSGPKSPTPKDSSHSLVNDRIQRLKDLHESASSLATTFNNLNISITSFFFVGNLNDEPMRDNSYLGDLCLKTGGRLYMMRGSMMIEESVLRLEEQLSCDIQHAVGSNATWKLRSSVGLKVDRVLGSGQYQSLDDELQMSSIDANSTSVYMLKYDAGLKDEDKVYLQLAVLYTAPNKQRLVRVHNLTLIASNKASSIFRNSDIEAVMATFVKLSQEKCMEHPLNDEKNGARTYLQNNLIEILLRYRKLCSPQSPRGQLILPEALKVLPIYTLGTLKHPTIIENPLATGNHSPNSPNTRIRSAPPVFESNQKLVVHASERIYEIQKMLSQPIKEVINSIFPRLYNLLTIIEDDTDSAEDFPYPTIVSTSTPAATNYSLRRTHSDVGLSISRPEELQQKQVSAATKQKKKLLMTLSPSAEVFESDQIYVVDDRSFLWMYIGRSVPQDLLEELFVLPSHSPYDRPEYLTVRSNTNLGSRVESFFQLLVSDAPYKQEIRVIWADLHGNNPSLNKFATRLIEDANSGMMTYVDYLCNVHAKIQSKL